MVEMCPPYRDDVEALEARKRELGLELRAAEERRDELRRCETQRNQIEAELRAVDRARENTRRYGLRQVPEKTLCGVNWSSMTGSDRMRTCGVCKRTVYNTTTMSPPEIEAMRALVEARGGKETDLYLREDGTMMEGACPVPARQTAFVIAASVGLIAVAAVIGLAVAIFGSDHKPEIGPHQSVHGADPAPGE